MTLKQKLTRISLILFIALVIAVFVEILFSAFTRFKEPDVYEHRVFSDSEFQTIEVMNEDDSYITLANNAYFGIDNIRLIKVQSVDIYLIRAPEDRTEAVLRFTGIRDGVHGTFTTGLKKIENGVFRAVLDTDSVEMIHIYPTELNQTNISFSGIEVNKSVVYKGFSVYRIFLWAALAKALYQITLVVLRYKRDKKITVTWTSVYFVLLAVIAVFTYISCSLFSTAKQMGYILIPLSQAAFSLFYLFIYLIVKRIAQLHQKIFLLFIASGIAFTFATAPLQVPDEGNHFARCYAISMGSFTFDGNTRYPAEVERLYSSFTENIKMYETYQNEPSALQRMMDYLNRDAQENYNQIEAKVQSNSQLLVPYLPAALTIAITRVFTSNALVALYIARLTNVFIVAFSVLFALKTAVRNKVAIILTSLFPLTVFMASSASYDAMVIAALIIYLGLISKDYIEFRDFICLAASFSVIVLIKPLYLPLALLVLSIPKKCFSPKMNIYVMFSTVLIVGIVFWQLTLLYARLFSSNITPSQVLTGVDKSAQVMYILKNPLRFLTVVLVDGFRSLFYIGEYGLFGHLDVTARLTSIIAPIQIVLCSGISYGVSKDLRRKNTLFLFCLLILMYIVTAAGFYVVDSSLGGSTILGIQARYFIPSIFIASGIVSNLFTEHIRLSSAKKAVFVALYSSFAVSIIAAVEVFTGYYIV